MLFKIESKTHEYETRNLQFYEYVTAIIEGLSIKDINPILLNLPALM